MHEKDDYNNALALEQEITERGREIDVLCQYMSDELAKDQSSESQEFFLATQAVIVHAHKRWLEEKEIRLQTACKNPSSKTRVQGDIDRLKKCLAASLLLQNEATDKVTTKSYDAGGQLLPHNACKCQG